MRLNGIRRKVLPFIVAVSCVTGFGIRPAVTADESAAKTEQGRRLFDEHVRAIFKTHCYECHSHDEKSAEGGLVLDSRAGWAKGGFSGAAIVPGDPDGSLLFKAVSHQHKTLKMPPDGKLSDEQISHLRTWIASGAPDSRSDAPDMPVGELWSLQPLQKTTPTTNDSTWPSGDIDRFVLARLEKANLKPAREASPETLLRRLHFDLIGLPPTIEELEHWTPRLAAANSDRQAAIEQLVDSLLDSPHFGERWGRHWLDLVRFAESNGGDRNVIHPHAWRFRDYVIASFNADKPYDVFIREQIAGDLMSAKSQNERDAQWIATGMLTLGPKLFMETDSEQFRMDRVDEQIDVVSRAVLALTVSCSRCHDHKFDPITARDYHAFAGIFRSTYLLYGQAAPAGNQYGHDRPLQPIGADGEKLDGPAKAWKKQVADKTAERNKARSDRYRVVRDKAAKENKLKIQSAGTDGKEANEPLDALRKEIDELTAEIKVWDEKIKQLDAELKAIEDAPPTFPDYCMAVRDDEKIEDCHVYLRGNIKQRGPAVPRGFIKSIQFEFSSNIPADQSGRLQLADWLTHQDNPLTARVAVNRVWQHLFGEGLVRSVDNFGRLGERPTHPDLLDHLARQFIEDGWSIKRLIRRIVLSRTYQQSSRPLDSRQVSLETDPDNRLLWRQNPRRLEAEPLRDAILLASGTLNRQPPKASVVAEVEGTEFNDRIRLSDDQLDIAHRSVYLPIVRFQLPELLETFDFPDPGLVVGRRNHRTMASQQLFFLNNVWLREHAASMASRLVEDNGEEPRRIEKAFQRLLARKPTNKEAKQATDFLNGERAAFAQPERTDAHLRAWTRFCQALMASAEFRIIE